MFLARKLQAMVAGAIVSMTFAPWPVHSQDLSKKNNRARLRLTASDKREAVLQRAREQTLAILQTDNRCSAWFREADPDSAEVFESVHYEIDIGKASYIFRIRDWRRGPLYKHPWAARTNQLAGRNSIVQLNSYGPFFNLNSPVLVVESGGAFTRFDGNHMLSIASFRGSTIEAQMTILLHELGHITGRIPEDDDSWDGRSARNTEEVLRHCEGEIRDYAQKSHTAGARKPVS